jgi:hypothetical protein
VLIPEAVALALPNTAHNNFNPAFPKHLLFSIYRNLRPVLLSQIPRLGDPRVQISLPVLTYASAEISHLVSMFFQIDAVLVWDFQKRNVLRSLATCIPGPFLIKFTCFSILSFHPKEHSKIRRLGNFESSMARL